LNEEKKKMFDETVENLKHLDEESLRMMKFGSALLRDRDAMDRKVKVSVTNNNEADLITV